MAGTKAVALEEWAQATGQAYIRFDYRGCGESAGNFADQTIDDWRDDTVSIIDSTTGPVVLAGSSMGGWIMLLATLVRPDRIVGLVGIAPAPDFTDWGFGEWERASLEGGRDLSSPSLYSDEPTLTTAAFWRSGQANLVLDRVGTIACPVRIIQGGRDDDVPAERAQTLADALGSAEVQVILIPDGDHRLSRDSDIAQIVEAVEDVIASL